MKPGHGGRLPPLAGQDGTPTLATIELVGKLR